MSLTFWDRVRLYWDADGYPQMAESYNPSRSTRIVGTLLAGVTTAIVMFAVILPVAAIGGAVVVSIGGFPGYFGHVVVLFGAVLGYLLGEPVGAALADHVLDVPRQLE